jgi:nicotine oxidoreductase
MKILEANRPSEIIYNSLILRKGEGTRSHKSLSCSHLENSGLESLNEIRNCTTPVKNVYKRVMLSPEVLEVAYLKISKNKGAMTPGTDGDTLDGTSRQRLNKIILELKDHTFEFKPARREYIPKANGKLRPLGIPSPRDKIVQQAMTMILEAVFEKHFSNTSHGFRPGRGCHTALKQVASWNAIDWFIEGDIQSDFDTIDHHILSDLISAKIQDQQFLELYWKAVRAGYVETKSGKKIDVTVGTPQGSIVSPICANIYLHSLDTYMENITIESRGSGKTSKSFKPYLKLHSRVHTLYRKREREQIPNIKDDTELREVLNKRSLMPSTIQGEGYRVYYVRYADDFLVGINGTRNKATQIREDIRALLEKTLKLTLSESKTKLTHSRSKSSKVLFLGTEIYRPHSRTNNQKSAKKYNPKLKRRYKSRIPAAKLSLNIPLERVIKKLSNQGMCKIEDWNQGKISPTAKTAWMNLPLALIVEKYNSVLRGYRNFYSFADNKSRMQFIQYIVQHSCAKTICRKNKLHSRAQVFKKYGSNIKVNDERGKPKSLNLHKGHKRTGKFLINPPDPLDVVYHSLRSNSPYDKSCTICNASENIEMHHVRKLGGKTRGNMIDTMKALNRKQRPVCAVCHANIHKGIYDGISLKRLLKLKTDTFLRSDRRC